MNAQTGAPHWNIFAKLLMVITGYFVFMTIGDLIGLAAGFVAAVIIGITVSITRGLWLQHRGPVTIEEYFHRDMTMVLVITFLLMVIMPIAKLHSRLERIYCSCVAYFN